MIKVRRILEKILRRHNGATDKIERALIRGDICKYCLIYCILMQEMGNLGRNNTRMLSHILVLFPSTCASSQHQTMVCDLEGFASWQNSLERRKDC